MKEHGEGARIGVGHLDPRTAVRTRHPYADGGALAYMPDDIADQLRDAELDIGAGRAKVLPDSATEVGDGFGESEEAEFEVGGVHRVDLSDCRCVP